MEQSSRFKGRNGKQTVLEKSIVLAKKFCGMHTEQDTDRVLVIFHLLRPQESDLEVARLKAEEVVTMHK